MIIYGKVLDNETRAPVPGATVALYSDNVRIAAVAASGAGEFYIEVSTTQRPNKLGISSTGYIEKFWDISAAAGTTVFILDRDVKELPPVVIYPSKSTSWLWWVAGVVAIIAMSKKRN
jgi:hypothetical protein